jgi:predicted DNA-binding WGR domain protein
MSERRYSVYLRRVDPERDMKRFYELAAYVDLLGFHVVERRWGRLGRAGEGQRQVDLHPSEDDALAALELLARAKIRKGYEAC